MCDAKDIASGPGMRPTWHKFIGTTQEAFFAAHVPKPHAGGERQALMAVAYLLHCFHDIPSLGEVKRVALAEKIFGKERIAATLLTR